MLPLASASVKLLVVLNHLALIKIILKMDSFNFFLLNKYLKKYQKIFIGIFLFEKYGGA